MILASLQKKRLKSSEHFGLPADRKNSPHAACQELPRLDLLICDIGVGMSSGTDAALRVRRIHADVPVLFVSGTPTNASDKRDVTHILKLPLDSVDSLEKPFRPAALLERAEQLLANRAQRSRGKTAGDGR